MSDQGRHKGAMNDDPRLHPYFQSEDERRRLTQAMFDEAAICYDSAEWLTAPGSGTWYRRDGLRRKRLSPGTTLLEVVARIIKGILLGPPVVRPGAPPVPGSKPRRRGARIGRDGSSLGSFLRSWRH